MMEVQVQALFLAALQVVLIMRLLLMVLVQHPALVQKKLINLQAN
jgi:hypothetical protein